LAAIDRGERYLARRKTRIDRKRQEILAAAARVFASNGYAGTTVRQVAEAAEVAEGTLYNYFAGKREILRAISQETETPMEAVLSNAAAIHDRAGLLSLVEQALEVPVARLSFLRVVMSEAWVDDAILQEFAAARLARIHRSLTTLIADRIAGGLFRPVDPALTAQLVIGMFGALILPAVRGTGQPLDPDRRSAAAQAIVGLLMDGLRAGPEA
jgi:AcrR family transcriptional regulator